MIKQQRLQKLLSASGVLSRRRAEEAIVSGRVQVDGETVSTLGVSADPGQRITLDGKRIRLPKEKTVLALHKPKRVITSKKDPQGRRTVMEFVPEGVEVNPVGRLDYDTSGLLLLTNDGDLANYLMHPRYGVQKCYHATIHGRPRPNQLAQLMNGVELTDGVGRFLKVEPLKIHPNRTELEIWVEEGRNRFIRRMFQKVGFPVMELRRIQFGKIRLADLPSGSCRALTDDEISALRL